MTRRRRRGYLGVVYPIRTVVSRPIPIGFVHVSCLKQVPPNGSRVREDSDSKHHDHTGRQLRADT